ncbi:MAG: hypothetical protein ACLPTM_00985 [Steroidobacteraceae bacterium]
MIDVGRDFERMRDYMVGRLSDDERRAFEDRLGRDPELVRELEQSLRLREGLLQLKAQGYFNQPAGRTSLGARVRGLKTQDWLPALAAAAVGALALFLWVQPRMTASGVLRAAVDSPVAAQFTFMAMRSGSAPDLALPSAGPIELRVQPAAHATVARFRVTLLREGEHAAQTPVGALAGLALGADDSIHFYADSARLAAGTYRLQVEPDAGANGAAESFEFTLRGSGAPVR